MLDWCNSKGPGVAPDGGSGVRIPLYTTTARLKLGSLQPVRCCPTMVWVIATIAQGNRAMYARQEIRLNTFHLRSIRCVLGISWKDRLSNAELLSCAGLPKMYTLFRQCRLRWLGHSHRMKWLHPKRHLLWRASIREDNHWPPTAMIQWPHGVEKYPK